MSTSNDVNGVLIERANGYGETNGPPPVANKPKPPVASKPTNKPAVSAKPAPPVKRKPLLKSQSVDTHSTSKAVDLTQVGGSEWKDFVLKRQGSDETEQPPAIRSLNMHRQSLTCADATITEGHVLNNNNESKEVDVKPKSSSVSNSDILDGGAPEVISGEPVLKTDTTKQNGVHEVSDEAPVANGTIEKHDAVSNGVGNHETIVKDGTENAVVNCPVKAEPIVNGSDTKPDSEKIELNGTHTETPVSKPVEKPTSTTATAAPTGFILPKPRQIVSEIKRTSFAKSRSMSLPSTHLAPQIKRSSDILKEASAQPYFCRLSRGSVDILNAESLSGLSIKEETPTEDASSETTVTNSTES